MSDIFTLALNVLGGLGLFLYGLRILSNNLQQFSSDKLKKLLDFLTRNKVMGLFFGAIITSLLQSSSATTVIVIGFANAGLMKLSQCISIIFGANIGTTITAQIIAFKASNIALPLIGIGFLIFLFTKNARTRNLGEIILGLGMLFYGLRVLGSFLKPFKDNPHFQEFMVQLGHYPLLGILAGIVITVIIQSSSATTGMIVTLGSLGMINLKTAFVLELGSNIGTTITAQIAAIGTNPTAKRVAWSHTLFNVIGSLYMWALLYVQIEGQPIFLHLVNKITTSGNGFAGEEMPRHIANAHTLFNLTNAIILFPFINSIAQLTKWIIPEKKERFQEDIGFLDDRLIRSPFVAIEQGRSQVHHMFKISKDISNQLYKGIFKKNPNSFGLVTERQNHLKTIKNQLVNFMIKVNSKLETPKQVSDANAIIHIAEHLKRIADHACEITSYYNLVKTEDFQNDFLKKVQLFHKKFYEVQHYLEKNYTHFSSENYANFKQSFANVETYEEWLQKELIKEVSDKNISAKTGVALSEILIQYNYILNQLQKAGKQMVYLNKNQL